MKFKEILLRHEQLTCCDIPSRHVVVANGGLGNGVEREDLWSLFDKFGGLDDVVMKPRKPYAFVSFTDVNGAIAAVASVNGRQLDETSATSPVLYLLYVREYDSVTMSSPYVVPNELPSGLVVIGNYISPEEEVELIACLDWQRTQDSMKHRRVLHYGYKFKYESNDVDRQPLSDKIPSTCSQILNRLLKQNIISSLPDQLTVNEYQPGQGIPPHVDTHSAFGDMIIIFNLQSQITMEFRNGDRHVSVVFPRLSVVLMSGTACYQWTHGITPRTMDIVPVDMDTALTHRLTLFKRETRTSFTFRTVRQSAVCQCEYSEQCDSQQSQASLRVIRTSADHHGCIENVSSMTHADLTSNETTACQLESDYVHKVYEVIANHFSDTRHSPWPRVASFISQLSDGAIVADIGCGNGKYLGINRNVFMVGCDRSLNLCRICHDRGHESFICDSLEVPLRDNLCDAVLCIAVIHHMSTTLRRQQAVAELVRVLHVGGRALIYVWALEQQRGNIRSKYLANKTSVVPKSCNKAPSLPTDDGGVPQALLPVHVNRTTFEAQDLFVPWHLNKSPNDSRSRIEPRARDDDDSERPPVDSSVLHRYYHTFIEGELERLCVTVSNTSIVDSYYDQGNWCVILEKLNEI